MENTKQFAFEKGWDNLKIKDVTAVRAEIMAYFGFTTIQAFQNRRSGDIEPRASDVIAIEAIFEKYGVPVNQVWGKRDEN